jgi:hypothetical protein
LIGGKELPLFEMLFIEEELKAWEKEGRDIWGCVATSERLAIVNVVNGGGREWERKNVSQGKARK